MRDAVVTVFGGSGFIGRHVVGVLARQGAVLRIPTRQPARVLHLKTSGAIGQIVPLRVDLTSDASIAALLEGATHVVNLIGILYEPRPGDFTRLQAALPGRIARAASAAGLQGFVQLSAIGADGQSPSAYGRSKAEGEREVRTYFPGAVILRPSIVIGPEDGFFNRFAQMSRFAPALPLIAGGTTRFQPVYVEDVAQAVLRALIGPHHAGRTYELGGPATYSFKELLSYMLEVLGRPRALLNLPMGLARLQARVLELLPEPPLTRDQLLLLTRDNVVTAGMPGLKELGIVPTAMEAVVPGYLRRGMAKRRPDIET